jgi:SAM-dependent methyltransferase
MARLSQYLKPVRLRVISRLVKNNNERLRVLDIGCGNSSPIVTKKWLGDIEYHGLDIQEYSITNEDKDVIDKFILVSPDDAEYESVPDQYYDVLIMNHVIEHMEFPYSRLKKLLSKVKEGGVVWVAFPSVKSAGFPPAEGSLNFFDDETHIYLPSINGVVNTLLSTGVKVRYAGSSYDFLRWLIGIVLLPWAVIRWKFMGRMCKGLWFVFGFETVVYGIKK